MTILRITRHQAPFTEHMTTLAKTFVNLRTLHLCKMDIITNDGLSMLLTLPNLTCFDFNSKGYTIAENITDMTMIYLGLLTTLRDLDLLITRSITDAGVKELTSLTSLTRLGFQFLGAMAMDSARWLVHLTGLRELMLMGASRYDGIYCAKLTSLTKLYLSCVTDNIMDHLGSLVNLRDLDFFTVMKLQMSD